MFRADPKVRVGVEVKIRQVGVMEILTQGAEVFTNVKIADILPFVFSSPLCVLKPLCPSVSPNEISHVFLIICQKVFIFVNG